MRRRLDVIVAELANASRTHAQALIMAGRVTVDGAPSFKPGTLIADNAKVEIAADDGFVSRGGQKLEHALDAFDWSVDGEKCIDVGASTGGFTDCLLRRGARSVTCVDVGYGQLDWRLRNDPRVIVVERTNFRHADLAALGAPFDFACADVSFISLAKLADQLRAALAQGGRLIALVKPQFEAGRERVQRGGVVRDPKAHAAAIEEVAGAFARAGFTPIALTFSPVKGPAGNIEFLLGARAGGASTAKSGADAPRLDTAGVVAQAHERLDT